MRWLVLLGWIIGAASPVFGAPAGFVNHVFNGRDPVTRGGETQFLIMPKDCSPKDYGDGRGESNCSNGNVSARLAAKKLARPGQELEYAFDIWIDPGLKYRGHTSASTQSKSRLEIALWQRTPSIKSHLYELELDAIRGVTFEDIVCFGPKRFGAWNSFSMKVKWSKGQDGYMRVTCNNTVVLDARGTNLVPAKCGTDRKFNCIPKYQKLGEAIQWQVGPLMRGYGPDWAKFRSSQFETIQPDGITMKMRSLYLGRPRKVP